MIVEAQATPRLASKVVEKVRTVTDKPISHAVLTHYHAVRVLGASAFGAGQIVIRGEGAGHSAGAGLERLGRFHPCERPGTSAGCHVAIDSERHRAGLHRQSSPAIDADSLLAGVTMNAS